MEQLSSVLLAFAFIVNMYANAHLVMGSKEHATAWNTNAIFFVLASLVFALK